jgi:hypothetical protein
MSRRIGEGRGCSITEIPEEHTATDGGVGEVNRRILANGIRGKREIRFWSVDQANFSCYGIDTGTTYAQVTDDNLNDSGST